jgi:hypothetical protein
MTMDDATISGGLADVGTIAHEPTTPIDVALPGPAIDSLPIGPTVSDPNGFLNDHIIVASVPSTTVEATVTKTRKPRTPKAVKRGRGRPNVYVGALLALIVAMIRSCHNVSLVRACLTSSNSGKSDFKSMRQSLATACGLPVLSKPLTISLPMLGKYAADAGIEMPKGRPSFAVQESQLNKLKKFVDKKTNKQPAADAA